MRTIKQTPPRWPKPRKGTAHMAIGKNVATAALYVRVSTDEQTTTNQERELREAADAKGLEIAYVYRDNGVAPIRWTVERLRDQA